MIESEQLKLGIKFHKKIRKLFDKFLLENEPSVPFLAIALPLYTCLKQICDATDTNVVDFIKWADKNTAMNDY